MYLSVNSHYIFNLELVEFSVNKEDGVITRDPNISGTFIFSFEISLPG